MRVQRLHHGPHGHMLTPAAWQPRAGPDPRMHPMRRQQGGEHQRGRADPQLGTGRQRTVSQVRYSAVPQHPDGLAALVSDHLVNPDAAAQRGGQHAARAGADDQVDVIDHAGQALLQGRQRAGHPGSAEDAARTKHQSDPRSRVPGPPFRTHDHPRAAG